MEASDNITKGPRFGKRHVQILLLFWLCTVNYALRSCMSIAIVAMTDPNTSPNPNVPVYHWDNTGVILSAFFWSYIVPQVFAGHITKKYGPKWILAGTMLVNSIASALIPLFAEKFGSTGVIICRVLQGLSQGFVFPCCHSLLGQWAPVKERALLGAITYSGVQIGQILALPITGFISASWVGWPVSFYVMAGIGSSWIALWVYFGANSPSEHTTISFEEKTYIQKSLGQKEEEEKISTPWCAIISSVPYLAMIAADIGYSWIMTTFTAETPSYIQYALNFDIESNGLVSTTPNIVNFIMNIVYGIFADFLVVRGWPIGRVRKTFHFLGTVPAAIGLTALGFIPREHSTVSVVVLVVSLGSTSAIMASSMVNHMDLSPRFAGVLMGISNTISMAPGIVTPIMVQYVVTDMTDVSQWRIVFLSTSGLTVTTMIVFVIFGSGEVQWWDRGSKKTSEIKEKVDDVPEKIL